jgi:hypothetical protein
MNCFKAKVKNRIILAIISPDLVALMALFEQTNGNYERKILEFDSKRAIFKKMMGINRYGIHTAPYSLYCTYKRN